MDARIQTEIDNEPLVDETSVKYLGRWNRLVSTTNWEKGRIICQWREDMIAADALPDGYTDQAWSHRAGNVSPQHVGRLRRVFQRFGETFDQYAGLYWSHFQAATDWPDAEMWLEGAVQSGWSVSQMRNQQWEAMGAAADKKPMPEDVIEAEPDEDIEPAFDEYKPDDIPPETISGSLGEVRDDADADGRSPSETCEADERPPCDDEQSAEPFRPFEDLPPLPLDLAEAFEAMKLAILQQKLSGWQEISLHEVLSVLDALKQLALAPVD